MTVEFVHCYENCVITLFKFAPVACFDLLTSPIISSMD